MTRDRLIESPEGWSIAFSDAKVSFIHIDFRLGLDICSTAGTIRLVIETPCTLGNAEGKVKVVPDDTSTLAPVLMLFNVGVKKVETCSNGELTVVFSNGCRLNVSPNAQYEAWQMGCNNEFLVVCQPGGVVAVFRESTTEL